MAAGRRGDERQERQRQAFALKGTMPAVTMLCLQTTDVSAIEHQLADHISQMPHFFLHMPVMIDLEALGGDPIDLGAVAQMLKKHKLVPMAVRNATDAQRQRAVAAGFGVLQTAPVRSPRQSPQPEGNTPPATDRTTTAPARRARDAPPEAGGEPPVSGLTVRQPVRSGQVVYAPHCDLVVLAPVSSGAELIADGNIHVYAPLRGRALAGAHNNPDASVFCMSLEAEFVSIAGHYLMADEIPEEHRGRPARIAVQQDGLVVTRL
jgi:septum site-determining protein MinC